MRTYNNIPWNRYALIAELAKRLDPISPQFGKTALQKLVFLLQEVYKIDCDYDFELYSYGPYDSQLNGDLDLVEHWKCISVIPVNDTFGGYKICPTETVDSIREKASSFLDNAEKDINDLVLTYGHLSAKNLELRATIVFVAQNLKTKGMIDSSLICEKVGEIKPKYSTEEIKAALNELITKKHIVIND